MAFELAITGFTLASYTLKLCQFIAGSTQTSNKSEVWDPEPISIIATLALLNYCPHETKIKFQTTDEASSIYDGIGVDLPKGRISIPFCGPINTQQAVTRAWNNTTKSDLGKLTPIIRNAIHLFPPEKLPGDPDFTSPDFVSTLLSNKDLKLDSITKLYVLAVGGLQKAAKTYNHTIAEIMVPVDVLEKVEDPKKQALRDLRLNYQLLMAGLKGEKMTYIPSELENAPKDIWKEHDRATIYDHIKKIGLDEWGKPSFDRQRGLIKSFIQEKQIDYLKLKSTKPSNP